MFLFNSLHPSYSHWAPKTTHFFQSNSQPLAFNSFLSSVLFFFFTISQGILKDDRPFFTSSTACHQGLCALIHTCIYKTSSILIIAFSWTADVFLRLSSFCYHDKFTVYLFAIFLFLQPHLIISFLIKCIASNNAHLLFSRLSLSLSLSTKLQLITVMTRYAICFSYYVAHLLSVYHLL